MTRVRIAMLGLGTVGRAFARRLSLLSHPFVDAQISAIADSSGALVLDSSHHLESILTIKESGGSLRDYSGAGLITDLENLVAALPTESQVLVESLPTNIENGQPALNALSQALSRGINVVTVDKGPVVHGIERLLDSARQGGSRLAFTGTTGVRAPAGLKGAEVLEIRGILNGTTNHVLSAMQSEGVSFSDALARAQSLGIAESDPRLDLEGWDTACKVLILARTLMGASTTLEQVSRMPLGPEIESLVEVGHRDGRVVKFIGRARIWRDTVRVSVAPKLVGPESPLHSVSGTGKLAVFRARGRDDIHVHGASGLDELARTIMDDIIEVAGTGV